MAIKKRQSPIKPKSKKVIKDTRPIVDLTKPGVIQQLLQTAMTQQQGGSPSVAYPEQKIFLNGSNSIIDQVKNPAPAFLVERFEYPPEGGILLYYIGRKFPTHGFVYPEAMHALNQAKAMIRSYLILAKMWLFLPSTVFLVCVPHKYRLKTLNHILAACLKAPHFAVAPHLMREQYYIRVTRAVRATVQMTAMSYGIFSDNVRKITDLIGAMVEYDNAYRMRLQDMLGELDRLALYSNPKKELLRILDIGKSRELEGKSMYPFYSLMKMVVRGLFLFLPKNAITTLKGLLLLHASTQSFQMDEADWYNVLMRGDYSCRGVPPAEREAEYVAHHKDGFPPHVVFT